MTAGNAMITGVTAGSRQSAIGVLRERVEREERKLEQNKALLRWLEEQNLEPESDAEHALWNLLWEGQR